MRTVPTKARNGTPLIGYKEFNTYILRLVNSFVGLVAVFVGHVIAPDLKKILCLNCNNVLWPC